MIKIEIIKKYIPYVHYSCVRKRIVIIIIINNDNCYYLL